LVWKREFVHLGKKLLNRNLLVVGGGTRELEGYLPNFGKVFKMWGPFQKRRKGVFPKDFFPI